MSLHKLHEGDDVSRSLNGPHPSDAASEIKGSDISVVPQHANDIAKAGAEAGPAAHTAKSENDVAKAASELKVLQKEDGTWHTNGTSGNGDTAEKKEEKIKGNGVASSEEAKVGEKRKADEKANAEPAKATEKPGKEESVAKKQKTANGAAPNGTKAGPGRPKGSVAAKKEKKVPRIGTAQRKTRSQGSA